MVAVTDRFFRGKNPETNGPLPYPFQVPANHRRPELSVVRIMQDQGYGISYTLVRTNGEKQMRIESPDPRPTHLYTQVIRELSGLDPSFTMMRRAAEGRFEGVRAAERGTQTAPAELRIRIEAWTLEQSAQPFLDRVRELNALLKATPHKEVILNEIARNKRLAAELMTESIVQRGDLPPLTPADVDEFLRPAVTKSLCRYDPNGTIRPPLSLQ